MIDLVALAFPQGVFDAATKVTSWWALGAFAIAAVVAILLGTSNKGKSATSQFPVPAVIVIVAAVIIPVAGAVIVASFPGMPYRVTIIVEDATGAVVSDPHITSSVGGQESKTDGGALIEIPATSIPSDGQVTFWADKGTGRGKVTEKFDRTRSVSVTIPLTETVNRNPSAKKLASSVLDPLKRSQQKSSTSQQWIVGTWRAAVTRETERTPAKLGGPHDECSLTWKEEYILIFPAQGFQSGSEIAASKNHVERRCWGRDGGREYYIGTYDLPSPDIYRSKVTVSTADSALKVKITIGECGSDDCIWMGENTSAKELTARCLTFCRMSRWSSNDEVPTLKFVKE
jgi:hypothetical protein